MEKLIKWATVILAFVSLLALTACEPHQIKLALTVIEIGGTANQPADVGPAEAVADQAIGAGRAVKIITTGRTPVVVAEFSPREDLIKAQNDHFRAQIFAKYTAAAHAAIEGAAATTDEHAPFDAIVLGDRFLTRADDEMWIFDSLLSTAGLIRFQDEGMLTAEPDDIVSQLDLGKLRGNTIHLVGAGDVALPQEALSPAEKRNLIEIATKSLEKGGATVDVVATPRTGPGRGDLPVTVVPVQAPVITLPAQPGPIEVPVSSAEFFAPDSDVLVDPDGAARLVAPFAAWAAQNPAGTLEIHGLTARTDHPHRSRQEELGMARAVRIKGLLVDAGVADGRITCFGEGSYSRWFVPEHGPRTWAVNRKVIIRALPGAGEE
jgi:outer membrane protein OmpA-like peptidoglycan-associated protein